MYTRRTLPAGLALGPAVAILLVAARPAGAAAAFGVQNVDGGQTAPGGGPAPGAEPWRSALYPTNWTPGFSDAQGRFLHDFSFAGYHRGEVPVPTRAGSLVDVTQAPYLVDKTGIADVTPQIQRALDDAGSRGGGVVYLPAGTYRVRPQDVNSFALHLRYSNVVLRGAGRDQTLVFNDATDMRGKKVLYVAPRSTPLTWHSGEVGATRIETDLPAPTTVLPVASVEGFAPGDWVVVKADATDAWIAEHGMTGKWTTAALRGVALWRRVVAVARVARALIIDTPTRYPLLRRDGARVYKTAAPLQEVGVEQLAIGMRENLTPGTAEEHYDTPGTGAYQMHDSYALYLNHVVDGWIKNVSSFRPKPNVSDVHLLSNGVRLEYAARVTVDGTNLAKPQYKGGGGNGYHFSLGGNDCLLTNCKATAGRHNYSFRGLQTSGNVVLRSAFRDGALPADFHMFLSMANLIDNATVDGDTLQAVYRPHGTVVHGQTTTQSVFWNTNGLRYPAKRPPYAVISRQFGWGYVIGTRGPCSAVSVPIERPTEQPDYKEGEGHGDTLVPASLYEDQLRRRRRPGTSS